MAPRRSALRLERLEVRRALAADDGSDPWDGVTPPDEGDVDVGGDVGGDVVVEWSDPGDVFVVMPAEWSGDGEKVPDGGLPMCWLPDYDAEGNPIPQPFWRTTGDDPSAGLLADGDPIAVDSSDDGLDAVSALSRPSTDEGPRSRPTDVVATSGPEGIVVSWNDPFANSGEGGPAIDGYLVEARRLRDADWSIVGSVTGATTVTVSGLDGGAHYAFRVTKTNLGMLQMLSAPSVPSRPLTTPGGVTIGVEQTAAGGARISWDPGNVGGGEQIVEFRRLAVTEWVRAGSFPAASGAATIDGLPGGRHYTFRILSAGGIYSPRSRAVTLPEQVDYLLRATSDAGGTVITWSDPLAATRTETIVEYRRLRDTVWSDLGSVASAAGEIGLAGLVPNAHYVFRLRQRDADGFLSRTVATRPVTVQPRLPDCWLPPPAPPTVDGSTLLLVNPYDGSTAPTLIHVPGSTTGGSAPGATGALVATGQLVASTSPLDTPVLSGDDHAASGDGAAG